MPGRRLAPGAALAEQVLVPLQDGSPIGSTGDNAEVFKSLGEHTFFATIEEAVSAYRAVHPVEWVD